MNARSYEEYNHTDVLGVIKYYADEGSTTPDPRLRIIDILVNGGGRTRITRSVHPEYSMEDIDASSENSKAIETTLTQPQQEFYEKHLDKRSSKVQNILMKQPQRVPDSVEEFSISPEIATTKPDIPSRRNKNRSRHNIETLDDRSPSGKKKSTPVIHFDGDSSGYVVGKHTNYNGNGHLSHPSQIYSDWMAPDWVKSLGMDEYFQVEKGLVKVKEGGLYLVYAQIYYLDDHDTNGYRVYQNEETLAQCTTMTHSAERIFKGNTCYTSRVAHLKENDVISIRDLGNSRYTIFENGKSFFGLIKLK